MAITLVASVTATPGPNGGATGAIDTTGATCLVISASWRFIAADLLFSDSKGNTWVPAPRQISSVGDNVCHQFAYCLSPTVGTGHTFTVSQTTSYPGVVVYAFAGTTGYSYQVSSGSAAPFGSTLPTGTVTPTANAALILSGFAANTWPAGGGVLPPGIAVSPAGFTTTPREGVPGTSYPGAAAYYVQPTAAAINPTWGWTSGTWGEVAATTVVFVPGAVTSNHGFRRDVQPGLPLEIDYLSTADPLYVFLSWYVPSGGLDDAARVDAITFNGDALDRCGHKAVKGNTMEWWRLLAPDAGVGVLSLSTTSLQRVSFGAMNLTGWPAAVIDHRFEAAGEHGIYLNPAQLVIPTFAGAPMVAWLGFNSQIQDVTERAGMTSVWNEEGLATTPNPNGDQLSAGATSVGTTPRTPVSWELADADEFWGLGCITPRIGGSAIQKVTQQVLLVGIDEEEDETTSPPRPVTPCVGGGDVADGTNPAAGPDLSTATVPIAWVEIELEGGTRSRYAKAAIPHGLPKVGRVLTFGRVARRLTDGDGGPQASIVTTVLADTDRALRAAAWAGTLHFALVEYFVADLETIRTGGTPHRVFRGRVQDWTADQNLTLTLTVQDELSARLTSANAIDVQSPIRTIDRTIHDFQPLASLYGQAAPEIYGALSDEHEDPPIGEAGTWELRHIADQTIDPGPYAALGQLAVFLVCSGAISQIQQIYAADPSEDPPVSRVAVPESAFGNWLFAPGIAWVDPDRFWTDTAGRRWTVVLGLASHPVIKLAIEGRIPLVVNLCGYEDFGEGTGETITRPARAVLHWLNNRVVQDTAEDWRPIFDLGGYSLFDTLTFDAVDVLCEARGYRVAGVIGHDYQFVSWRDRVAEWCRNFGFEIGTNQHGQVICVLLDPAAPTVATLTPATILEDGCQVTMRADAVENIIPYVFARNYVTSLQQLNPLAGSRGLRDPFDGEWQSDRLEVVDEDSITALGGRPRGERKARPQEYSLVRDEATAADVAARRLALRHLPNGRAEVTFDLLLRDGWALELGAVVALEHWDVPWTPARRCQVRALDLDLDALTMTTTVRDVEDLLVATGGPVPPGPRVFGKYQATPMGVAVASTIAVTFTAQPEVGSAIVVALSTNIGGFTPLPTGACTDNAGNTYVRIQANNQQATGTNSTAIYLCSRITSSVHPFTVTLSPGSSGNLLAQAFEVSGVGSGLVVSASGGNFGISAGGNTGGLAGVPPSPEQFGIAVVGWDSDTLLDDHVFGLPRLERVWNLLDDLDKVTGGGAEAFWQGAYRGYQLNLDKDLVMDDGDDAKLSQEVDEFTHGLRRFVRTRGVEMNALATAQSFITVADADTGSPAWREEAENLTNPPGQVGQIISRETSDLTYHSPVWTTNVAHWWCTSIAVFRPS